MRKLKPVIFEGLLWITIACVAFALTYQFDKPLMQYRYGAAGWPRALIVAIVLFALIQALWNTVLSSGKEIVEHSATQITDAVSEDSARGVSVQLKRLATFGVPVLYLLLMPRTGFYIATPLLIAGYMALLGERRLVNLVGTTLLIYVLSLIIFTKLLFVPLPVGNWPGFYDLSSFFVSLIK